jgi:YHS domain-containing protein
MKTTILMALLAVMTIFAAPAANAADPIYTSTFSNIAVGGYDTVSYFSGQGPVKGKSEFSTNWQGAKWNFASAQNLASFKSNPEKYAPQYGGYCAWAASQGSLAKGNPQQWHIENGKLYLNVNKKIKQTWLADKTNFITKADQKFPALIQ